MATNRECEIRLEALEELLKMLKTEGVDAEAGYKLAHGIAALLNTNP